MDARRVRGGTPRLCLRLLAILLTACAPAPANRQEAGPTPARAVQPLVLSAPGAAQPGMLAIAAIFPSVGRFAASGTESHRGVQMAVEEVNAQGGVRGQPLQLLRYDTGSFFLDAAEAARRAEAAGALAIVGSNSSALSEAAAQVAEERGIPMISNVSSAPDLTWSPATGQDRPFVFRMCGSDDRMGERLADFARETLQARRVAVIYEIGRPFSLNLTKSFVAQFRHRSERTTAEYAYLPFETDFRPQLTQAAAFGAEVVFVPGSFPDASLVAAQSEAMGFRPTLVGGDGWASPLLFRHGVPGRTAYYGNHCAPSPEFLARYRARFGEGTEGCRAILAHDAVRALAAAFQELEAGQVLDRATLGSVREQVRDALSRVDTSGASGPIRFDGHGDREGRVFITEVRVRDGKAVQSDLTLPGPLQP